MRCIKKSSWFNIHIHKLRGYARPGSPGSPGNPCWLHLQYVCHPGLRRSGMYPSRDLCRRERLSLIRAASLCLPRDTRDETSSSSLEYEGCHCVSKARSKKRGGLPLPRERSSAISSPMTTGLSCTPAGAVRDGREGGREGNTSQGEKRECRVFRFCSKTPLRAVHYDR